MDDDPGEGLRQLREPQHTGAGSLVLVDQGIARVASSTVELRTFNP